MNNSDETSFIENDSATKELNELRDKYNVGFSVHFPEEIDFGTFYYSVRKGNLELFEEVCKYSRDIGVDIINLHLNSGIYFSLPEEKFWIYGKYKEEYINNLMDSYNIISKIAKTYEIKVCIENTIILDFIEEIMIKLTNLENIYFTWDIGHDAKDEYKAKEMYLKNIEKIAHVHIHDYNGKKDHQILFDGILDIDKIINFSKKRKISNVIEVKTIEALRESIKRLKDKNYIGNY